mmetsp:Transcript_76905/g.199973  ORF Transcript_76905/g.199973 Transcript_76905/m.199973 type:complete len:238 (-) Transcript_76905:69-782(-)
MPEPAIREVLIDSGLDLLSDEELGDPDVGVVSGQRSVNVAQEVSNVAQVCNPDVSAVKRLHDRAPDEIEKSSRKADIEIFFPRVHAHRAVINVHREICRERLENARLHSLPRNEWSHFRQQARQDDQEEDCPQEHQRITKVRDACCRLRCLQNVQLAIRFGTHMQGETRWLCEHPEEHAREKQSSASQRDQGAKSKGGQLIMQVRADQSGQRSNGDRCCTTHAEANASCKRKCLRTR